MKNVLQWVDIAFAFLGGILSYFFGKLDGFLIALLIFMCVDIVTGIIKSFIEKTTSSKVSFKGLSKKIFMLLLVGVANIIDTLIFPENAILRTAVIFFYMANEGISILENVSELGLPVPSVLKNALAEINKKGGNEENEL